MCIICAAIPATAAIGDRWNAGQIHKEESRRLPAPKITAEVIGLHVIASAMYQTLRWES